MGHLVLCFFFERLVFSAQDVPSVCILSGKDVCRVRTEVLEPPAVCYHCLLDDVAAPGMRHFIGTGPTVEFDPSELGFSPELVSALKSMNSSHRGRCVLLFTHVLQKYTHIHAYRYATFLACTTYKLHIISIK